MIEDNVEQDAHSHLVRLGDKPDEILARAKMRIDFEEVLHAVAVKCVEMPALLEDRAEPDCRNAQIAQVSKFAAHTVDSAALPMILGRLGPKMPAPWLAGHI